MTCQLHNPRMESLDLAFSKVKYWNQNIFVHTSDPAIRLFISLANSLLKNFAVCNRTDKHSGVSYRANKCSKNSIALISASSFPSAENPIAAPLSQKQFVENI